MGKRTRQRNLQKFSDGVRNPLFRIGEYTRNGFNATHYAPGFQTFKRTELDFAYQSSWMCGLIIDIIAEDMTRAGIDIECEDPEKIDRINRAYDRKLIWSKLSEAIKWARLYGGSIAVMLIDGDDMSKPLGTIRRGAFKGLAVFDRWQIQPSDQKCQTLGNEFGRPEYYQIVDGQSPIQVQGGMIHRSRVLPFYGRKLPYYMSQAYQGWGASILEPIYDNIKAFDLVTRGTAQLVNKAHLRYYKVAGLRDILTNELARDGFLKQMDAIREFQGIEGMTLGDTEDDFQVFSYSFTGLPEVLIQFGQQVSGGSGIPLVRLFGQSPTGFNATGESDLRLYYDDVSRRQNVDLRENLRKLNDVIYQSLFGTKPESDFDFEFVPLWQMDTTQKIQNAVQASQAIVGAMSAGALTTSQALKELSQLSEQLGIFASITPEDIEEAEEMDNESGMMPPLPGANNEAIQGSGGNEENRNLVQETPEPSLKDGRIDSEAVRPKQDAA